MRHHAPLGGSWFAWPLRELRDTVELQGAAQEIGGGAFSSWQRYLHAGVLSDAWRHVLVAEYAAIIFLVGFVTGCVSGAMARTLFWLHLLPLGVGATLLYVAVYIM